MNLLNLLVRDIFWKLSGFNLSFACSPGSIEKSCLSREQKEWLHLPKCPQRLSYQTSPWVPRHLLTSCAWKWYVGLMNNVFVTWFLNSVYYKRMDHRLSPHQYNRSRLSYSHCCGEAAVTPMWPFSFKTNANDSQLLHWKLFV